MAASLTKKGADRNKNAEPAPLTRPVELETARLRLRPFVPADLDALVPITSDPEVMRYIGEEHPLTREETEANLQTIINGFRRRGFGRFALIEKAGGALLGYCGLGCPSYAPGVVELVYLMARAAWGRGLASEASRACLRYGFEELRLAEIIALTKQGNLRSRRVMERLGMRYVRDDNFYGYACVRYAISRDDWRPDNSIYVLRPAE